MLSARDWPEAVLLGQVGLSYLGLLDAIRDPDDVARDGRVRVQVVSRGGETHCHVLGLVKADWYFFLSVILTLEIPCQEICYSSRSCPIIELIEIDLDKSYDPDLPEYKNATKKDPAAALLSKEPVSKRIG